MKQSSENQNIRESLILLLEEMKGLLINTNDFNYL